MPGNTYDRYVTWAIDDPGGVAVPRLDRWSLPTPFPDPEGMFYPKNIVPMYAIRNTADATVRSEDGDQEYQVAAGSWWIFNYPATYSYISDDYFYGSIPDTSSGSVYPSQADRDLPVNPPSWVGDPNPPGCDGNPNTPNAIQE